MARKVPRTPAEFSRVSGVGRAKLEDLGGPFLERINAYAREQGWPEPSDAARSEPARSEPARKGSPAAKAPRVVNQSYRETGQLISEGASLSDVAEARGLTAGTILGHLERLVEEGVAVEWDHLLPSAEGRAEIEAIFGYLGDNPLRPVWEELEGRYSYDEIRLVRLAWRNGSSAAGQAETPGADPRSMMGRGVEKANGNTGV